MSTSNGNLGPDTGDYEELRLSVTTAYNSERAPSVLQEQLNSRVQHPVARVSIGFNNVTTVRNYFLFLFLYY
jgi:hypothetical protein